MAMSTQVLLISLFILVDSYLFALDVFEGRNHPRIPLGLPNPFNFYPEIFNPIQPPPPSSVFHKDPFKELYKPPFTSDFTTYKSVPREPFYEVTTNKVPVAEKYDSKEEDTSVHEPDIESEVFLMKNVKVPEVNEPQVTEKEVSPEANTLSIHEDPKQLEEETTPGKPNEAAISEDIDVERDQKVNYTNDPGLTSYRDFILIPVDAVNPTSSNAVPNSNILTPTSANIGNVVLSSSNGVQNVPPNFVNLGNNVNGVTYSQPNQPVYATGNLPDVVNSGASNNVYTIVTVPNNPNQPNNFYVPPNNPPLYSLVPINNQPNTFAIVSNQPKNLISWNNQPNNNYVLLNNNLVPVNNQPLNLVPVNNRPSNLVPVNNQPNTFVPINNQPNNIVPLNNIPNSVISLNNQPVTYIPANNNFAPISSQPNNLTPINNQPNNVITVNNLPENVIFNNQPNNYIPPNNNFVSLVNQPNNGVSANNVPITSNSNLNGAIPVFGLVSNTRDQDEDEKDKEADNQSKDDDVKNYRDD